MKKRITSMLLALAIVMGLAAPAFALSSTQEMKIESFYETLPASTDAVSFVDFGNGLFQPLNNKTVQSLSTVTTIQATPTDCAAIFHVIDSDYYLVQSFEDNYVLTIQRNIDVTSFQVQDYPDIPSEILKQLELEINQQKAIGNDEFRAAVYKPASINRNSDGGYWGDAYEYNSHQLKDYYIDMQSAHTGFVGMKGTKAAEWGNKLVNVIISVVGLGNNLVSTAISVVSTGVSVLDYLMDRFNLKTISTSSSDEVDIDLIYHKLIKNTYVEASGNWFFALSTFRITVTKINTYCFFKETGNTTFETSAQNKKVTSANYNNPAKAIEAGSDAYIDAPAKITIVDKVFTL